LVDRPKGSHAAALETSPNHIAADLHFPDSIHAGRRGLVLGRDVTADEPFAPDHTLVDRARELAAQTGGSIAVTDDPAQAATEAEAIYTDVHESMGQPDDPQKRLALAPYKVTMALMAQARPSAVFMHCLPMQRDMEVEAAVADGPQSIVFEQAANRLHMHKAVLLLTMG